MICSIRDDNLLRKYFVNYPLCGGWKQFSGMLIGAWLSLFRLVKGNWLPWLKFVQFLPSYISFDVFATNQTKCEFESVIRLLWHCVNCVLQFDLRHSLFVLALPSISFISYTRSGVYCFRIPVHSGSSCMLFRSLDLLKYSDLALDTGPIKTSCNIDEYRLLYQV